LGLNPQDLRTLKELTSKPYGMLLVTGPTGSGKTTTLYSILSRLNSKEENIVTIEDPVEYRLPGINQSQVNPTIGVTFASGLRSMLRQDPNIIMVGEIRDAETATISVQAALTGHLVFTTLHTNDAPGAVTRLFDMGVKNYLISSSVIGVVAQRLVRTICRACREPHTVDVRELCREFGLTSVKTGRAKVWRGRGCKYCSHTGYQGRVGVFEVMTLGENLRKAVIRGETSAAIRRLAVQEGMSTLRHSAFRKVVDGVTTLDEVRRAVFMGLD
ncbi:MAG: GspE/PulE family protein, partial [bacterium]